MASGVISPSLPYQTTIRQLTWQSYPCNNQTLNFPNSRVPLASSLIFKRRVPPSDDHPFPPIDRSVRAIVFNVRIRFALALGRRVPRHYLYPFLRL